MKLNAGPFLMIARGEKTIESRLYDEKRQKVAPGDDIIFTLTDDTTQTLTVRAVGLLPKKFGGDSAAELATALKKYYSQEAQIENGVLAIEFELVSSS